MAHQNFWEDEGVYRKFSGEVTGAQLQHAVEEVEGDPRFDLIRYVINDFLEIRELKLTKQDAINTAAIDSAAAKTNSAIKIALIAEDKEVLDLLHLYEARSEATPYETKTFRSLDAARDWVTRAV